MSLSPWQTAVLAIATWLLMHLHNNFEPSDTIFPHSSMANTTATTEAYYSENYYQARALFREHARAADAELHTLPFEHLAKWDLTVDIAVVKGARDRVLVHLSGTHGVEGFAGSAIQSAVLAQLATGHKATADRSNSPTLVFIHAVNPFGFAMLRRFNEHNVDLNRNWLSEAQFADFTTRDPNTHGYMDLYSLFNPTTDSANWNNWFWPRVLVDFATKGFNAIKQAVITGNYNMPTTIFYGGDRLQPTLVAIKSFLATQIDWTGITQLAVLDIHTGLGKSGEDTVMIMPSSTHGVTERLFPHEFKANRVAALHDSTNPVTQGYEDVAGYVAEGIATLLPSSATCEVLALVQEFGTVPGVFVLKATAQENAFYHHAPTQRLPYAERIRDVFYTHRSASWKNSVLARGTEVFASLTTHLSSTSTSS